MEHLFFKRNGNASAEDVHIINPESGYFAAQDFTHDPEQHLIEQKAVLMEEGYISNELTEGVLDYIEEMKDVLKNENIHVDNELVSQLLQAEYLTYDWAVAAFTLLRLAQFSLSEVETWVEYYRTSVSPEAELVAAELYRALEVVYKRHK